MGNDLTNRTFGRLTARETVGKGKQGTLWHCECQCGGEKIVPEPYLTNGHTRSCGCILRERRDNAIRKAYLDSVHYYSWANYVSLLVDTKALSGDYRFKFNEYNELYFSTKEETAKAIKEKMKEEEK